jgi:hypothetical protein
LEGIVHNFWLDETGFDPGDGNGFFFPPNVQTRCEAHITSNGNRVPSRSNVTGEYIIYI